MCVVFSLFFSCISLATPHTQRPYYPLFCKQQNNDAIESQRIKLKSKGKTLAIPCMLFNIKQNKKKIDVQVHIINCEMLN